MLGLHAFHCVGEKYIAAVADGAAAIPVLVPALGETLDWDALLTGLDGILLTGSPSNVEPHHYGGPASEPDTWHDPHRDATTLPAIRRVIDAGMPLLAICRGFQEMNVAYGGSLHQKLHTVPGLLDHREDKEAPLDVQYGPAHEIELEADGQLAGIVGTQLIRVNSLHSQGVDRLGAGLTIEGRAPDGLIEAFRVAGARAFALAVQWHPEWKVMSNDFSRALFAAFGQAARERSARHHI